MAADVLLNGQGNSGTILSHFFVSLAEHIKTFGKDNLTLEEFAACLVHAGAGMDEAVPNPVEGTLLSVCRDACRGLQYEGPFESLKALLDVWNRLAQQELAETPKKLVVNGVKVLEKAGVVDSGAKGFVYLVEGMFLACKGELPEASDPSLFKTSSLASDETANLAVDHTVTDSRFRYCTEAVVLLKDDVDQKAVLDSVKGAAEDGLGDSIASVAAPAKEGGRMVKIHIHTNNPQRVFDHLRQFSRSPLLKKEKVEDMYSMREFMNGGGRLNLQDSKFSIVGLCAVLLPQLACSEDLVTIPVSLVPETTQEPIDLRFATDSDACIALNLQRHKETAIRYTTAAPNPMRIKIELLAALAKGKPVLVFVMSTDKRVSAMGRNIIAAVNMLAPEQRARIKVYDHAWGPWHEPAVLMEAIRYANEGKSIDEALEACKALAERHLSFSTFVTSDTVQRLAKWRPGLFPEGFVIDDDIFVSTGIPVTARSENPPPSEAWRTEMLMNVQRRAASLQELQDAEVCRIKEELKPGEKIASLVVQCVGRIDYGHAFVEKLKAADVPMEAGNVVVYNMGLFGVATFGWGDVCATYKVVPE